RTATGWSAGCRRSGRRRARGARWPARRSSASSVPPAGGRGAAAAACRRAPRARRRRASPSRDPATPRTGDRPKRTPVNVPRTRVPEYHGPPAEPRVPPVVMDRPVLHAFVRELAGEERLGELAEALPTRARVPEAALPVVLAALWERLERPLVCLVPEDVDARDVAEAAAWFLGEEAVGTLPSRGVRWGSGLEPPPHLVGERARALAVLARGGLVVASAQAVSEGLPPAEARPEPIELAPGRELGVEGLSEALALAGYDRVERVDDRGQFAVRGGLVDVFPTTGREPLRIEFFGDEIESIRAFSPFTQRALHPVESAAVYAAVERRLDLVEEWHGDEGETRPVPDDLVPPLERVPDFVFQPDGVRRLWSDEGLAPIDL